MHRSRALERTHRRGFHIPFVAVVERVVMKKFFAMLCLAVLFAATGEARAAVIEFNGGTNGQEPASWQTDYDNLVPGVDVQFTSPYLAWDVGYNAFQNVAIGNLTDPLIIDFVGPVKLNSFGLGNNNNTGSPTQYKIYNLLPTLTLLYDSGTFSVPYDALTKPTYFGPWTSLTGIRIELQADPSSAIGIDDISFEAATSPANVPEPVTIAIWGIGACGMGIVARRKKKQTA